MTKILIKRHTKQVSIPKYETIGSSGMDVAAFLETPIKLKPNERALVRTGLSFAIPKGFEIQIRPRSGLAAKNCITVLNTPGTIDSDYRGEIKVILYNLGKETFEIVNGLRIAQMVLCPIIQADFEEVEDLSKTVRGEGGFGSTGSK
mgnify:CR=1 FL=1|jgi:dUTP pyrophosphatase